MPPPRQGSPPPPILAAILLTAGISSLILLPNFIHLLLPNSPVHLHPTSTTPPVHAARPFLNHSQVSQQQNKRLLLHHTSSAKPHGVKLRLMHKSSPNSPFRKVYATKLEALQDANDIDLSRIEGFRKRLQIGSLSAFHAGTTDDLKTENASSSRHETDKSFRSSIKSGAGAGAGQYFVDFYIGTPPQKFLLIADTGSDLVWVRCSACASCDPRSVFDPKASSSYSAIACLSPKCVLVPPPPHFFCNFRIPSTCKYDYVYADLSDSSGVFSLDTVSFNSSGAYNVKFPSVAFGCGLRNNGQSFVGSGGVMGLGRGSISFASQIGSAVGNKFSYCFVDFFQRPAEDSYMVFGNAPASKLRAPFKYTPIMSNPFGESFYYVRIQEVTVDDKALRIPSYVWEIDGAGNRGTVVDSGTTLTFFVEPAYRRILAAMRTALVYPEVAPILNFDLCFNASGIAGGLSKLPKLGIRFEGGACFDPPPNNYFIDVVNGVKCLGLQGVESPIGFSVLGNLLQQNYYVEYDRDNWQLGFASADCSAAE